MEVKQAISTAKDYLREIYSEEDITNFVVDEVEHLKPQGDWRVTLAFSRPWNSPRTRAQEVLEKLGSGSHLNRSYKTVTVAADGSVSSMRNPQRMENTQ